MGENKKCSVEGCLKQGKLHRRGNRFFPRGFCNTHYKTFCKNNRDIIDQNKIKVEKCCIEDCQSPPPYKKEMCNKHYIRDLKYGDCNHIEKRREGQTENPLYSTYGGMRKRCLQESDKDYNRYGGNGITICDRWLGTDGFFNFIEDMGKRPHKHTLDRIDSKGNYEPSNCRWASVNTQNLNKNNIKNRGVLFYTKLNKYRSRITVDGISYELGMFSDLQEAIQSRIDAEVKYLGKEIEL